VIFDPSSGTFSLAGSWSVSRDGATATMLSDRRVLVAEVVTRTGPTPRPTSTARRPASSPQLDR
jgi:hypothetical protein